MGGTRVVYAEVAPAVPTAVSFSSIFWNTVMYGKEERRTAAPID
jgi:hypothetical protein